VFCNGCGKLVPEGSKFCLSCGSSLPAAQPSSPAPMNAVSPLPNVEQPKKKGGGAFFSSPAGIALIVILAIAVIGGLTIGIIFLVKGDSNNSVDAETMKVWDEYNSMLNDTSANLPKITTDQGALAKSQADLKKAQERAAALENVLKKTGGTTTRRQGTGKKATNTRDVKADQMAAALASYDAYVTKMDELFTTLIGANLANQNVVNNLNTILSELQKLGDDVKTLSNQFLANNPKATTTTINPPILTVAKTFETDLQTNVTNAEAAAGQQPKTPAPTPATPTPAQTPAETLNGTYVGGDYTITFNSDGTWSGVSTSTGNNSGTYTVSSNTVTLSSTVGGSGTGEIQQDGSILLSNGTTIERQ